MIRGLEGPGEIFTAWNPGSAICVFLNDICGMMALSDENLRSLPGATLASLGTAPACDISSKGSIDITDIRIVQASLNTPAVKCDPRDPDGDGTITANDARMCVLRCTKPGCA